MSNRQDFSEDRIEGLFELHRAIISIFFKGFEDTWQLPDELNYTHMKAVMILGFHGHLTMSELSGMLAIEKGSFTPVARKLIGKGLIEKKRSAEDLRVYHLVLTEEGRELMIKFMNMHGDFIKTVLNRLSPEEKDRYFRLIEELNGLNRKISGRADGFPIPCRPH